MHSKGLQFLGCTLCDTSIRLSALTCFADWPATAALGLPLGVFFQFNNAQTWLTSLLYALRLCSLTDVWLIKELFSQLMPFLPSATKSQLQSISWHSNVKIVIKFTRKWCFLSLSLYKLQTRKHSICLYKYVRSIKYRLCIHKLLTHTGNYMKFLSNITWITMT